jgi:hypothetical protein
LECRHRNGNPKELWQRNKSFIDETREDGNIWRSRKGNLETIVSQRLGKVDKVANLGRVGGLERVKPIFGRYILWRTICGLAMRVANEVHERMTLKSHLHEGREP